MIEEMLLALILVSQVTAVAPAPPTQVQLGPTCVYDAPNAIYDAECVYQ